MCVTSMRLSIVLFLMLASVLLHHVINSRWPSVKPTFYIRGKEFEYVEEWPHLGNLVHANGSDQKDIINKNLKKHLVWSDCSLLLWQTRSYY